LVDISVINGLADTAVSLSIWSQVLEEIRVGLELNDYGMQQRQLAHMRFLGELYNYEHIDSSVIFETLYLIIVFGHGTTEVSKHICKT
jgi:regulator of nonsense transcripts 2